MITIKTTIQNGRIEVRAPDELPEGTEVLIDVTPILPVRIGIPESEWRDDPQALADWDAWIRSLEPIVPTPEEAAEQDGFEEEFRRFNVEAVRKQMMEDTSE
jgi:hypothetical protein